DGVVQGEIELAVTQQIFDSRGVAQGRRLDITRHIGADWVGKMRTRLGIILQHELLRLRRLRRLRSSGLRSLLRILRPARKQHENGKRYSGGPPKGGIQMGQKHASISRQSKLVLIMARAFLNQELVRKSRRSGFIFVLAAKLTHRKWTLRESGKWMKQYI